MVKANIVDFCLHDFWAPFFPPSNGAAFFKYDYHNICFSEQIKDRSEICLEVVFRTYFQHSPRVNIPVLWDMLINIEPL